MSYDNTDKGVLFVNDKKESERHPDYNGSLNVNGTEFWLSGWKKKSKAGKSFLSLSIKPKQERQSNSRPPAREQGDPGFPDEPF